MSRENNRKIKHKNPKFRDFYDDELNWEDLQEIQQKSRKPGKKSKRKDKDREKDNW